MQNRENSKISKELAKRLKDSEALEKINSIIKIQSAMESSTDAQVAFNAAIAQIDSIIGEIAHTKWEEEFLHTFLHQYIVKEFKDKQLSLNCFNYNHSTTLNPHIEPKESEQVPPSSNIHISYKVRPGIKLLKQKLNLSILNTSKRKGDHSSVSSAKNSQRSRRDSSPGFQLGSPSPFSHMRTLSNKSQSRDLISSLNKHLAAKMKTLRIKKNSQSSDQSSSVSIGDSNRVKVDKIGRAYRLSNKKPQFTNVDQKIENLRRAITIKQKIQEKSLAPSSNITKITCEKHRLTQLFKDSKSLIVQKIIQPKKMADILSQSVLYSVSRKVAQQSRNYPKMTVEGTICSSHDTVDSKNINSTARTNVTSSHLSGKLIQNTPNLQRSELLDLGERIQVKSGVNMTEYQTQKFSQYVQVRNLVNGGKYLSPNMSRQDYQKMRSRQIYVADNHVDTQCLNLDSQLQIGCRSVTSEKLQQFQGARPKTSQTIRCSEGVMRSFLDSLVGGTEDRAGCDLVTSMTPTQSQCGFGRRSFRSALGNCLEKSNVGSLNRGKSRDYVHTFQTVKTK